MQGLNVFNVTEWMRANVADTCPPFSFDLLIGGRSNLTFRVVDAVGRIMVLRRPPLGHVLATAHDMTREHRVISALERTVVPVPKALGLCTDLSVNAAPFYVMEHVGGTVVDSADQVEVLTARARLHASEQLIDVLADLHDVDIDDVGLGDFAKREGFIERQLRRWAIQWENGRTREISAVDEVARRLRTHIPKQSGVSIVHGDYRFGNCLIDLGDGHLTAVLDWELCTLGDPLADVGYLGVYLGDGGGLRLRASDPVSAEGFLTYDALLERYERRTGRDLSDIAFYVAFSHWRLAVISEGVYSRYLHGAMGSHDLDLDSMRAAVDGLAERALNAAASLA